MGLSLGNQESTQRHALLSVHELSIRCMVTSHGQTLKEVMWSVSSRCGSVVYVVICGLKSRQ